MVDPLCYYNWQLLRLNEDYVADFSSLDEEIRRWSFEKSAIGKNGVLFVPPIKEAEIEEQLQDTVNQTAAYWRMNMLVDPSLEKPPVELQFWRIKSSIKTILTPADLLDGEGESIIVDMYSKGFKNKTREKVWRDKRLYMLALIDLRWVTKRDITETLWAEISKNRIDSRKISRTGYSTTRELLDRQLKAFRLHTEGMSGHEIASKMLKSYESGAKVSSKTATAAGRRAAVIQDIKRIKKLIQLAPLIPFTFS